MWKWIGGGILVLAGTSVAKAYSDLTTGVESLDRFAIRARVLVRAALNGVPARVLLAIINQESRGNPAYYLGDTAASGGPSIGPGQVYRQTAKDYGLWEAPEGATPEQERAAYTALATDEDLGIAWAAQVLAHKYREGDGTDHDAIRRYNGSGSAAQEYAAEVSNFISSTWGDVTTPGDSSTVTV